MNPENAHEVPHWKLITVHPTSSMFLAYLFSVTVLFPADLLPANLFPHGIFPWPVFPTLGLFPTRTFPRRSFPNRYFLRYFLLNSEINRWQQIEQQIFEGDNREE